MSDLRIEPGSINVTIPFAMATRTAVTSLRSSYSRFTPGNRSVFTNSASQALTEKTNIDDDHVDNEAIYFEASSTDPAERVLTVDFPDAAFASGVTHVVLSVGQTSSDSLSHFLIRLENETLVPTTNGNSLDVTAAGLAGIDLDNTVGALAKGTEITGFNDLSAAQVNTEVDLGLSDINLDHLLFNVAVDANVTNDSLWAQLTSKAATPDYSTFDNITDSLEALADMSAPSAETIADAVWDEEIVDAHQLTNSAAFILSNLFKGQVKLLSGTASSTNNTVTLTSGNAEIGVDVYKNSLITTHDDFPGQTRLIVGYSGATKIVTVFPDWTTNPASSNGVGTSLIILAAGVTPASLEFIKQTAITESTTGRNAGNWSTFYNNVDNVTTKVVDDVGGSATGTADAVWDALRTAHTDAGSFGEFVNSNLVSIEGSATIDSLAITTMFENIISHAQGDVVRVANTYTYKKQDGTTTTYSYTVSAAGRT